MPGLRSRLIAFALASLAALSSYASVQITGLQKVSDAEARKMISEQIELIENQSGSRPLADDASFFLERELRRKGFNDADVQWRFDEATRDITLIVDEGAGHEIGEIKISGNIAGLPDDDIRALVRRATANRLRSTILTKNQEPLPYVEADIAAGLADVGQFYRSLGYWDATTAPLEKSVTKHAGSADIHVQIESAEMHRFREFEFVGDTAGQTEDLKSELAPLIGQPCSTHNVNRARATVVDFFSQRGHYRHTIEVTPDHLGDEVALVFSVDAGSPFEVNRIRIAGIERVKADFLEKRFAPLIGEAYSPEQTDKVYRELLGLGLFTNISVTPKETGADNLVDLLVTVEEAKARSVGVHGGYGSYEGAILGFIFRENNVFGTGRQFKATAEYTQRGLRGELDYDDKWFFESPYGWNPKVFALTEEREGYTKFEKGGRVGLRREIGDHYSVTAFATLGHTKITDAEIDEADTGMPSYWVGSVGLAHSWDTRDNPALPTRGFIFDNTIEYADGALASDVDFLRGSIRFTSYIPITKRTQLSLGARSGFIMPTGDSESIPIDLRFFSGGSTSVRSFREKHLGPRDQSGYPLGGEFYNTFNAEYTVPIVGGLKAAVFADAGNLLSDFDNASLDDLHYALGAGLRYDLPTGPIRIDYGWNMNRGAREPSGTLHISIGVAF